MTSAAPPPPSRRVAGAPRPDPPQRPLLWAAAAMAAGIAADRAAPVAASPAALATVGAVAAAVLAIAWVARRRGREHLGAALVLTAVAMLGALWHHGRWNYFSVDDLGRFARDAPQPTCVEGVVVKHVSIAPAGAHDPLRAIPSRPVSEATVRLAAPFIPTIPGTDTRLRVAGELRGVAPGDRVVVFAQLGRQPPPLNPGQFDWRNAERRERRLSELYCTDVRCVTVVVAEGWGWS
ncbi:MAG TPA: DUF4131 domain-containing protein, partial [Lacipirellulaceae bacterium]|nr:DUF4131 domain-containing protein [Lacipirellulaceae bacterium]